MAGSFKDSKGKSWEVAITVATIKRVRSLVQVNGKPVDLLDAAGGDLLKTLMTDPVALVDTLYVVCKPQADAQNVTDEQFGELMAGDTVDHATTALLEGLADFFPQDRKHLLKTLLSKVKKVQDRMTKEAKTLMDSPELDQRIEAELNRLMNSSGNVPASSLSTPTPSPSAN